MKPVYERVKELRVDLLVNLIRAVDKFDCGDLDCSDCPLCDEHGICISMAALNEFIRRNV